jgi:uncharacterized protein (DUF169 family)
MDAGTIKQNNLNFSRHFPAVLPSMGWYFAATKPDDSIVLPLDQWSCIFKHIHAVAKGAGLCFSKNHTGCNGAACYLGFRQIGKNSGRFLASKEKFKKNSAFGNAFYGQVNAERPGDKYLILSNLEQIEYSINIEVVNYWVTPLSLAGLVTLANFDSPQNNNTIIPFASGCQSMWTLPYKERKKKEPKAVIGAMDPAMRRHIKPDTILFSVSAGRFHEMAKNISLSFASEDNWLDLIGEL